MLVSLFLIVSATNSTITNTVIIGKNGLEQNKKNSNVYCGFTNVIIHLLPYNGILTGTMEENLPVSVLSNNGIVSVMDLHRYGRPKIIEGTDDTVRLCCTGVLES